MDTETIEVIDRLRVDIHQIESRLTARIDGVGVRFDGVDGRFDGLDARVGDLDARVAGLDERQERRFEEARRHFEVIAESLRDDIRMIADGLVALIAKVDGLSR